MKSSPGNFFEDFRVGQTIVHATPRTVTPADAALNIALTGSRYALLCSDPFAQACGLPSAPIDPLLVFHIVFGKSVADISLNAVANLGYAEGRFLAPVYPGDTLSAVVRSDRPQGEFQRQDRHRHGPDARDQSEQRHRAVVCALGDGEQARCSRARTGACQCASGGRRCTQ